MSEASENEEKKEQSSSKALRMGQKQRKIKLVKLNTVNASTDKKNNSVGEEGQAQNYRGKPEKIIGATQKLGELFFYIKFENKTKPVFVRAKESLRIFWLLISI